jgi:hypothetical protein
VPQALTPSERTLRARMAAHKLHSRYDSKQLTQAARDKFDQRFYDEVDPDRTLPDAERERRAGQARKSYFSLLALRSSLARRRRSE